MCGIVGYIQIKNVPLVVDRQYQKALAELLFFDSIRGFDSTGIAVIPRAKSSPPFILKKAIPGFAFIDLEEYEQVVRAQISPGIFLGHNRAATRGEVSDANAHPFVADHITLVHNGSINNMKFLDAGVKSDVDSEHIAHAIAKYGASEVLPKLDGSAILVWYNATENSMNIAKTRDRYIHWIFDDKDTCWFASEREMLWSVLRRNGITPKSTFFQPDEFHHYKWELSNDADKPGKLTKQKFEEHIPEWKLQQERWERERATKRSHYSGESYGNPYRPPSTSEKQSESGDDSNSNSSMGSTGETSAARYECTASNKIRRINRTLEKFGLCVGSEIIISRHSWTPQPDVKSVVGNMIGHWNSASLQRTVKVRMFDIAEGYWTNRPASGQNRVIVYNCGDEIVSREFGGGKESVLYAKPKAVRMSDMRQGPANKLITRDEFVLLAAEGCPWCNGRVDNTDHEEIEWVRERPLCKDCSSNFSQSTEKF